MSEKREKDTRSIPYTEHLYQMKKLQDLYEHKLQALRGYYESELAIRSIALPYSETSEEILDMEESSSVYDADFRKERASKLNADRSVNNEEMQEDAAPDMEEISDEVSEGSHYENDRHQTETYSSDHESMREGVWQAGHLDRKNEESAYENRYSNVRPGDYDAGYIGADGWAQHHVNPAPSRTDPSVYLRPGIQRTGADGEEGAADDTSHAVNDQTYVDAERDFQAGTEPEQTEFSHIESVRAETSPDTMDEIEESDQMDDPDDTSNSGASNTEYTPEQFREIIKIWSQDNATNPEQADVEEGVEDRSKRSPETGSFANHPEADSLQEAASPEENVMPNEKITVSAESGYDGYENQPLKDRDGADPEQPSYKEESQAYENSNIGYQDGQNAENDARESGNGAYLQEEDSNTEYRDDQPDAGNVNVYLDENVRASYQEDVGKPETASQEPSEENQDVPHEEAINQEAEEWKGQAESEEIEEQAEPEEPSLRALGYDEVYAVEKDDLIFHYQRLELLKSGKRFADAEMFVAPFDLTKDRPDLLVWVLNGQDSRDYCSVHRDPTVYIKINGCPLEISAQLVPSQTQPGKAHLAVRITLPPEQKQQGFQIHSTTQIHDGVATLCVETDKSTQIAVHMAPLDFHNDPDTGLVPFAYCIEKPGRRICGDSIDGPVYCDADGYTFELLCKWDGENENTVYGVLESKE